MPVTVDLHAPVEVGTVVVVAGRQGVVWVSTEKVRAARDKLGLSQDEVGRRLGHSSGDLVGEWERGRSHPDPQSLWRLAQVLGVKPLSLLKSDAPLTLATRRVLAGFTQAQAAKAISDHLQSRFGVDAGLSRETWSRIERGVREPTTRELDAITAVLGVNDTVGPGVWGELSRATAERLEALRREGESPDDLIQRLVRGYRQDLDG